MSINPETKIVSFNQYINNNRENEINDWNEMKEALVEMIENNEQMIRETRGLTSEQRRDAIP